MAGLYQQEGQYSLQYPTDKILSDNLLQYGYNCGNNLFHTGGAQWLMGPGYEFNADLNNMRWARAVMNYYSKNVPSGRCGGDGDWWANKFFFLHAEQYFKNFNFPFFVWEADQTICGQVNDILKAIDDEITSVNRQAAAAGRGGTGLSILLQILGDIRREINLKKASLDCSRFLITQTKQDDADLIKKVTDESLAKPDGTTDVSKYASYGVFAFIAIIAVIIVRKTLKKAN